MDLIRMSEEDITELLLWRNLSEQINGLSLEQVEQLLIASIQRNLRLELKLRIFGRWNRLRGRKDKELVVNNQYPRLVFHE